MVDPSPGGGFAQGFSSAFSGTLNTALQAQHLQLQEQSNKLEQYSTLGKIIKSYDEVDPAVGAATLGDFLKQMKVDPDTSKLYLDSVKGMSATHRAGAVDALNEAGLEPSAPNIQQLLRAGPANMYLMLGQMRTAKGMQQTGAALNEDPSSGGASPPAATAAPAASTTAAPAAPPGQLEAGNINLNNRPVVKNSDGSVSTVRSIGINDGGKEVVIPTVSDDGRVMSNDEAVAQYRASGKHLGKFDTVDNANAYGQKLHEAQATQYAPPAAPMPPAVQSAVGAPPATAMPGMPDGHAAPDATHSAADTPAYAAAQQYDRYMRAAARLESNKDAQGNTKPSYPAEAKSLRDEAEKIAKGAVINLPSTDARVKGLGLLPGTVVSYNTATRQMTSIQAGHETWNVLDPKDPANASLYAGQTPGTVISKNAQTGQYSVGVKGENMTKPATPAQLKAMNIDPASVQPGTAIMMDSTGKPTTQQLVPEQEVPVTSARRAELDAQGVHLNPYVQYTENKTTKALKAITTGQTTEAKASELQSTSNQKELDEARETLSRNSTILAQNNITRNLLNKYSTGPLSDVKLLAGQLADQFGVEIPGDLNINTAAGEALRATLGQKVVDQAKGLAGPKSARELQLLDKYSGSMLLTTKGNRLLTNISDWAAKQGTGVANLANNWQGPLDQPAKDGQYAGKNYYQAKAELQAEQAQGLPPELKEEMKTQTNEIRGAKAVLPKISTASEDELRLLGRYTGIMTDMEAKRAAVRWRELGLK